MGFDYNNLPKCRDCPVPKMFGIDKLDCAIHWRPGTGTKYGFPTKDGLECPRDSLDKFTEMTVESLNKKEAEET